MKTRKNTDSGGSDETRKILYRLLLMAVAVVYALVFVLDYILQLHFTFFLLLSLFGFVILTLIYMWFRVSIPGGIKKIISDENSENDQEEIQSVKPEIIDDVFEDAILIIDPRTGLTTTISDSAKHLFEAPRQTELTGIDFTTLLDSSWTSEDRRAIKQSLQQKGKVNIAGKFKTLAGNVFFGRLQAAREVVSGRTQIRLRILPETEASLTSNSTEELTVENEKKENEIIPLVFVGTNYRIIKANNAFASLSGYSTEQLIGLSFAELFPVEERDKQRKQLSLLFRGERELIKNDLRLVRANNEVIWVNSSAALSRNKEGFPEAVIFTGENITSRKRTERIYSDSRSKLFSLIENAEYSIITVDRRNTILLINTKLSEILFAQTGVVIETGFNLLDILPDAFREEYLDIHKRAFEGQQFVFEKEFTINGKSSFIELVVTPVREENGLIRTISFFGRDMSSRKQSSVENDRPPNEEISQTGFLATMSHEIRTPLNGVIGMGRLLSQTPLSPKQQEFVDSILLSGDALLSVINDILDYSKIESSKMELENKPFALKRCIEETFDLLQAKAIEKQLSLRYSLERGLPAFIYGDITRVRQVLMNLVSNAIKFTAKGFVSIDVTSISNKSDSVELRFDVKDTGIGIPPDKINRLFKSFSQADSSTARTYGGSGLGLAISKNLVELMGGKIWVESREGLGSDFIFTLPTKSVSQSSIPKQKFEVNKLTNSYALIISDDKTEAALYADYFKRWGMIPQIADNALHAVEVIKKRKDYNIVLLDSQLISASSNEIALQIRKEFTKDDLPIVLFNVMRSDNLFFDYTSETISAVIPKNADRSKVLDILISVFSVEEHQRTRSEAELSFGNKNFAQQFPGSILIAEDNMINQKLVQNIFEGIGYKPTLVSNGLQVIDKLKQNDYDFVFMDVQMPEMDGLEATRFIKKKLNLSHTPLIIAMTAFAMEGDKEKCIAAGMDDYISKPFLIEEITGTIEKWFSKIPTVTPAVAATPANNKITISMLNQNTLNRLKDMTGTDPTFFPQVIKMFINQGDEQMEELATALENQNLKTIGSIAHKLKGSSLNIGADKVAETCRHIELKARENDSTDMEGLIKSLIQEFVITKTELKTIVDLNV